jgi:multiple sugar transport system permease protein
MNIFITIFAFLSLFPIYWLFNSSFKNSNDAVAIPPHWVPYNPTLNNFKDIFLEGNAGIWMFNSVSYAAITVAGAVIISSMMSYAIIMLNTPLKRIITGLVIASLIMPKDVYLLPLYQLMVDFNWVGTRLPFIVTDFAMPFGVFLLMVFYNAIPREIKESATMDGCSDFRFFIYFGIPLTRAGIGAFFIIAFIREWNGFLWPFVMAQGDTNLFTLPVGVATLFEDGAVVNYGLKYAGAAVSALPLLLIFFFFQRFFTQGITTGSVKG